MRTRAPPGPSCTRRTERRVSPLRVVYLVLALIGAVWPWWYNAAFAVAHGTLVWPTFDLGLAVEFLHARANGLPEPRTRGEARANEHAIAARHLTESR